MKFRDISLRYCWNIQYIYIYMFMHVSMESLIIGSEVTIFMYVVCGD